MCISAIDDIITAIYSGEEKNVRDRVCRQSDTQNIREWVFHIYVSDWMRSRDLGAVTEMEKDERDDDAVRLFRRNRRRRLHGDAVIHVCVELCLLFFLFFLSLP